MMLEEIYYEITYTEVKEIIAKRFPCELEIEIISLKLSDYPKNAYIDVAFYFVKANEPREAFYTHLYYSDVRNK